MKKYLRLIIFAYLFLFLLPLNVLANSTGFVIGDYVSVRASKSTGASLRAKVIYGTNLTILENDGTWMKVVYDGQNTGYIQSKYVADYSAVTKNDPAYCNSLKQAGFPESYCPYLSYLHSIHPNWTFTASRTGIDFYTAVNSEGLNEIQLTKDSADLLNKYINAYAANGTVVEGSNWYEVNKKVLAYFMDPRNFLLEKTIFMFQTLSFNQDVDTPSAVRSVFGNSYLSSDEFVNYFVDGGRQFGVSALHLASKSVTEVGTSLTATMTCGTVNEKYTMKNGKSYSIYGLYNYYSIGAYSSESNPAKAALVYAGGNGGVNTSHLRPWTSRELAIKGGASFIANGYINKGQDNLYYEKFNTSPTASYSHYTNQYMANVMAPYQESYKFKDSLVSNNILNNSYNFKIPVYENMPAQTVQASLLSNNSLLAAIYVDGKIIDKFDEDITNYNYYVLDSVNHVVVNAALSSPDSRLDGGGEIALNSDKTTVTLNVTSAAGTVKTYVITIYKVKDDKKPSDIVGGMNVRLNDNGIYDLSVGTLVSTLISNANGISPYASVSVVDNVGKVVDNNSVIKTGYSLVINTVSGGSAAYSLAIHGDVNSDGGITIQDLLRIQKQLLGSINLQGAEKQACDVTGDGTINIQDLLRVQKYLLGSVNL